MTTVYRSDREFVIFSYSASHGQLLLRSGKTNELSTRVDVLFRDVRAFELRTISDGIDISEVELEYLAQFSSQPRDVIETGLTAYKVGNEAWAGFVLAGIVVTAEDSADFFDRSSLISELEEFAPPSQ